jgi:hypothetical protein
MQQSESRHDLNLTWDFETLSRVREVRAPNSVAALPLSCSVVTM